MLYGKLCLRCRVQSEFWKEKVLKWKLLRKKSVC